MENFLVVYEDLWGNKFSFKTDKVGNTILEILKDFEVSLGYGIEISEEEIEKLNNDFPYHLYKTNKIGDTILGILSRFKLKLSEDVELDVDRLNSDYPYEAGTFGPGFYDMELYDDEEDGEPNGRIMIFYIGEKDLESELVQTKNKLKKAIQLLEEIETLPYRKQDILDGIGLSIEEYNSIIGEEE